MWRRRRSINCLSLGPKVWVGTDEARGKSSTTGKPELANPLSADHSMIAYRAMDETYIRIGGTPSSLQSATAGQ
ncbi:MAG: hypothetical protein ABJN52_04435 [Litorimonas sp.]